MEGTPPLDRSRNDNLYRQFLYRWVLAASASATPQSSLFLKDKPQLKLRILYDSVRLCPFAMCLRFLNLFGFLQIYCIKLVHNSDYPKLCKRCSPSRRATCQEGPELNMALQAGK